MLLRNLFRKIITCPDDNFIQDYGEFKKQTISLCFEYYYYKYNLRVLEINFYTYGIPVMNNDKTINITNVSLRPFDKKNLDYIYRELVKFQKTTNENFLCIVFGTQILNMGHAQCLLFDKKNSRCEFFNSGATTLEDLLLEFIRTKLRGWFRLVIPDRCGLQGKDPSCFLWAMAYPWLRLTRPDKTLNDIYTEISTASIQRRRELLYEFINDVRAFVPLKRPRGENMFYPEHVIKKQRCC